MTYKEFKLKIEEIVHCKTWYEEHGDEEDCEDETWFVYEIRLVCREGILARFSSEEERSHVIQYDKLSWLVDLDDDTVYKNIKELVEELVETPVEERVQEQKYYVKLKLPDIISDSDTFEDEHTFLNVATHTKTGYVKYTLSDRFCVILPNVDWKIHFTNQEFEEIIPEEYRCNFELIPVEEE